MRRFLFATLLTLSLAAAAPAALAADAGAHGGKTELNLTPDLVVAGVTVATFLLLLVVLSKAAWKPILAGLKAREKGIRDAIDEADRKQKAAEEKMALYERKLAEAAEDARKILEEGRKDAEHLRARLEQDAKAEASRERERALRDIELARQQALKDVYEQVAAVATDAAARILAQHLDAAQHRRLVEEAVTAYETSRRRPPGGRG